MGAIPRVPPVVRFSVRFTGRTIRKKWHRTVISRCHCSDAWRRASRQGGGATIIDVGCGCAGPSLWVARETGVALVGVDLASMAIEQAARRAQEFGVADRAHFEIGDCTALRFAAHTFDAAMSVDVLWMVPDRPAALREVARIVKPGARFVFTNWDRDLAPAGNPPPVPDHRPLLRAAGFEIETYEEIPEAEAKRRAIYERYVASEEALRRELSAEAVQSMLFEARRNLGLLDGTDYLVHSRRIFVVARKSGIPMELPKL